ncbi:MAG: polysaccharide export protein [Nitrospinota bacterium]|nr:polysaccharide export protein [Nitrospinota bacterium]
MDVYNLGSGDKIRITVFGHADLSGEFLVDDTGAISMPLIGSVLCGGLTIRELEKTIIRELKDGYLVNPSVNVEVVKFRPFYIIGEVAKPGSYPYISGMTVFNAVALAGGFTSRAKKSEVMISRGGGKAKEVKLKSETVVLPGDIIEIPERFF